MSCEQQTATANKATLTFKASINLHSPSSTAGPTHLFLQGPLDFTHTYLAFFLPFQSDSVCVGPCFRRWSISFTPITLGKKTCFLMVEFYFCLDAAGSPVSGSSSQRLIFPFPCVPSPEYRGTRKVHVGFTAPAPPLSRSDLYPAWMWLSPFSAILTDVASAAGRPSPSQSPSGASRATPESFFSLTASFTSGVRGCCRDLFWKPDFDGCRSKGGTEQSPRSRDTVVNFSTQFTPIPQITESF